MAQSKPPPGEDSFWSKVVSECLENPVSKLPQGKRLLVLGDNASDKTHLVTKLQGEGRPDFTKGNGLEFKYLSVKDEYGDNQTKLGVWLLDGDPFYKPLLQYALDRHSLADTTVLLVTSMTKPWDIYDTIISWTEILKEHIETLGLSDEELEERKSRVLERFREYVEPGLSIYGSLAADNTRELEVNLGVELVVVVAKTEYMRELRSEFGYEEEHFDFLQFTLREFCLSHGAALFYVSVKEDRNCDFLLKYLLHKIYSFPFRIPGVLIEPDAVIVPAGWDTKNKIKFLSDGINTIPTSTPFEDVVFKPARLSGTKQIKPETMAKGDQEFLAEMQIAMERQASEERVPESAKENTPCMTATVVQRNVARRMTRAQLNRSPQKKIEAKIAEGDNTLSNFFHSLLNRKTPVERLSFPKTASETAASVHAQVPRRQAGNVSSRNNDQSMPEAETAQTATDQCRFHAEGTNCPPNAAQLSLDQESQQLPEYFVSNCEDGCCAAGCHFPSDKQFIPPLDRVRSSFNPPLTLLLEKSDGMPNGNCLKTDALLSSGTPLPCRMVDSDQTVLDNE